MKPIAGSSSTLLRLVAGAAVLGLLVPAVLAHGEEEEHGHADSGMGMGGMQMSEADKPLPEDQYAPTYFALPDHRAAVLGHIAVMVLAWVFALPAAVMLSLARSRYTLAAQLVFLAANAVGVLLGVVYNANTPDLYPNNAHHKLGWIVTFVVSAQVVVGLLARVAGVLQRKSRSSRSGSRAEERQGFIPVPVSTEAMAEHESRFPTNPYGRFSNDSGQGTEPRTESLRSHSLSSGADSPTTATSPIREAHNKEYHPGGDDHDDDDDFDDENFDGDDNDVGGGSHLPMFPKSTKAHSLVAKAAGKISDRFWKVLMFGYNFVDRTILILGFIALCTGIIAYGRLFEGIQIFSGLAHWIKGGVFFWLGIFTLGRWAGSFGDLGWAWNVRPKKVGQGWRPSAEFVESGLIFFYGSTNIFLEHLGGWGGAWSSQDLEHISLTVLFIGGGLCGMLIESTRIRNLLNYHITEAANTTTQSHQLYPHRTSDEERNTPEPPSTAEPDTYAHSMNPIPALVILLTGIMMSSHTQESMVSSMVHSQWGNLLTGASFARGVTYLITWLKPPKSVYPSRPPSELLTSFGLLSGGVIFMASASDTITGMIHYQLDAMFIYTVTMGLVGLLMAWIILCVAIKGWAARREAARA